MRLWHALFTSSHSYSSRAPHGGNSTSPNRSASLAPYSAPPTTRLMWPACTAARPWPRLTKAQPRSVPPTANKKGSTLNHVHACNTCIWTCMSPVEDPSPPPCTGLAAGFTNRHATYPCSHILLSHIIADAVTEATDTERTNTCSVQA